MRRRSELESVAITVGALQETLAGEHAAVWTYEVLGGQTSSTRQRALFASVEGAYRIHRGRRDHLVRAILDLEADPVAAETAYALSNPVGSPALVQAAALEVEQRCAATYAALVARTTGEGRAWAVTALTDAAVRQLGFRGSPEIFPGARELADR